MWLICHIVGGLSPVKSYSKFTLPDAFYSLTAFVKNAIVLIGGCIRQTAVKF